MILFNSFILSLVVFFLSSSLELVQSVSLKDFLSVANSNLPSKGTTSNVKAVSTFSTFRNNQFEEIVSNSNSSSIVFVDCSSVTSVFSFVNIIRNDPTVVIGYHFSHKNKIIDDERKKLLNIYIDEVLDGIIGKNDVVNLHILFDCTDGIPKSLEVEDEYVKQLQNEINQRLRRDEILSLKNNGQQLKVSFHRIDPSIPMTLNSLQIEEDSIPSIPFSTLKKISLSIDKDSSSSSSSPSGRPLPSQKNDVNTVDLYEEVLSSFVSICTSLATDLSNLIPSVPIVVTDSVLNQTMTSLQASLHIAMQKQAEVHLTDAMSDNSIRRLRSVLRSYLARSVLIPIFDRLCAGLATREEEQHVKRILKVPGSKKLVRNLETVATISHDLCVSRLLSLKTLFQAMLSTSVRLGGGGGGGGGRKEEGDDLFDFSGLTRRLDRRLGMINEDRVRSAFLSGSYNPYIRSAPFPPTHIVFNYLVDPRTLLFNSQYDRLYDEQTDAVVTNRADPLLIPGVSPFPFDPNDHPKPKDTDTPWHQLVYDFFTKE